MKGGIVMTRRISVVFMVFLLAAVICLSACGDGSDKKKFIGTWVTAAQTEERITVTFKEDGTLVWTDYIGSSTFVTTGRYDFEKDEKYITIYPDRDPNSKLPFAENEWGFQYTVTADLLTFYKKAYREEPWYTFKRQK